MLNTAAISDPVTDLETLRSELHEFGKRGAQMSVTRGDDLHEGIYAVMPDGIAVSGHLWREIEQGFRREWRNVRRRK